MFYTDNILFRIFNMSAIILLISVIFVLFMLSIFTIIGIAIFIFTIEEMVEKERDEY